MGNWNRIIDISPALWASTGEVVDSVTSFRTNGNVKFDNSFIIEAIFGWASIRIFLRDFFHEISNSYFSIGLYATHVFGDNCWFAEVWALRSEILSWTLRVGLQPGKLSAIRKTSRTSFYKKMPLFTIFNDFILRPSSYSSLESGIIDVVPLPPGLRLASANILSESNISISV
jgi:hypothetical protein